QKLLVFESISLDGYFVDAHGDMSWAHAGREDPEFADWVGGNASGGGALLFGRKTYQMMEAFWPTPLAAEQMPVVAAAMNARTKYVASRTIRPIWRNSRLLGDELVDSVRAIKAGEGPGVAVLGQRIDRRATRRGGSRGRVSVRDRSDCARRRTHSVQLQAQPAAPRHPCVSLRQRRRHLCSSLSVWFRAASPPLQGWWPGLRLCRRRSQS